MSDLLKAAEQALEELETIADEVFSPYDNSLGSAILALRDALNKQSTHGEGCWAWGPKHYECACKEFAKARGWAK